MQPNMQAVSREGHRQQRRMRKLQQEMQELQKSVVSTSDGSTLGTRSHDASPNVRTPHARLPPPVFSSKERYLDPRTPAFAANARTTDIMAVIQALQRPRTLSSPKAEESDGPTRSPSPSFTPPDRIDYESGVTIVTKPVEPHNEVMRIYFGNSHEFILTYPEITRGGHTNSFLQMWNRSEAANDDRPLRISMPNDRSPYLFQVIHAYLKGEEVIPLNAQHARVLRQHYASAEQTYTQLYREARKYGIYSLMTKIRAYQKHGGEAGTPPPEQFRVYDARTAYPFREEDLDRLTRRAHNGLAGGTRDFRVLVIGATIKWVTEGTNDSLVLSVLQAASLYG